MDIWLPHVFSDSDGVMFDFDRGYLERFGVVHSTVPEAEMWANIESVPEHFEELPLMPGALAYWEVLEPYIPSVLTGCPAIGYDAAAMAKRKALHKHFSVSDERVITCRSKDKPQHMKNPGDVLIDDFIANIKRWEKAGGKAIYYKHSHQAIYIFKKVMKELMDEAERKAEEADKKQA